MKARLAVVSIVTIALGILLFVGAAVATDSSNFCPSCHEMRPYYDSWAESAMGQQGVDCVDCHVGPGFVPRLLHKFVALTEVYSHVTGDTKFPRAKAPAVPDERCEYCHETIAQPTITGFSHADHTKRETCQTCHSTSGHRVTSDALEVAGILDVENAKARLAGSVTANKFPGHSAVACTDCHDMSKSACTQCHKAVHDERVDQPCSSCHVLPSKGWAASTHAADTPCTYCHAAPADHYGDDCGTCHVPTSAFADATAAPIHTGKVACTTCHAKPSGHIATGATCQSCHTSGGSWAFNHSRVSSSGTSCATCHAKPSGHPSTSNNCQSCHSTGKSWAFSHGSIPGGEHTYRSFSCVTCHPSGYAKYSCLKCHDSNSGGDD